MNDDDKPGVEEQFLELIPEDPAGAAITNDQALDVVDRIEWWGRGLVTSALSAADRAGVRDAHLRIADTLDAVAQRISGRAEPRIRSLAERWRLTGENLVESPVSHPREVLPSRRFSDVSGTRHVINQSGEIQVSSRSVAPSHISSDPSSSNKFIR
jgi:hypothetical protein